MQFGPWDLLALLFPKVWIIPVFASILAWIGAVQFWRRWGPKLLRRIETALPVVGGALIAFRDRLLRVPIPPRPLLILRFLVALPFFLVWAAGFGFWYLVGSIANTAGIGAEAIDLTPTVGSVILGGYGFAAMAIASIAVGPGRPPLRMSILVSLPLLALAGLRLVLEFLLGLLSFQLVTTGGELLFLVIIPVSFLLPTAAFSGGWAIVRGRRASAAAAPR